MNSGNTVPTRARILVVEDSSVFREMQTLLLRQAGYLVSSHEHPHDALAAAAEHPFDLVVLDYELPMMNGEELMQALRAMRPAIEVVFVSSSLTAERVIQLTSQRVAGIFTKPVNPATLLEKITETLTTHAARNTAAQVGSRSPLAPGRRAAMPAPAAAAAEPSPDRLAYVPRYVPGSSETFRALTHRLWRARDFRTVLLLQGETGSPFELLTRELVENSMFRDGPLMTCDATQFDPRQLLEVLAPALLSPDAGTLLVTGVETFNAAQQRMLEDLVSARDLFLPFARRFRLVLAATPALVARVADGRFSETLFYRINALTLHVPSLRELRQDLPTIARRILTAHRDSGHPASPIAIAADAVEWIEAQDWPGNYDELSSTLLDAVRCTTGLEITLKALVASSAARLIIDEAALPGERVSASPLPA